MSDEPREQHVEPLPSLDDAERALPPDEIERRWRAEITRRADRALRGESVGRDVHRVLDALEAKLRSR